MTDITLQIYLKSRWHDAAILEVTSPEQGVASETTINGYELAYFSEHASEAVAEDQEVIDIRALSVGIPVDQAYRHWKTWPPFLLDLMPQGNARRRIADHLSLNADSPASEFKILIRGASAPIGNIRVKEAWLEEENRIKEARADDGETGVKWKDIVERTDKFRNLVERYGLIASGSSGVQGEWPKILMTQAVDGLWHPDPFVDDGGAKDHVIIKLNRGKHAEDAIILAAEAPYLEIARAFGIKTGRKLWHENDVLSIPRFDRHVTSNGVERLGQESLVSAINVAKFGHIATHEEYLRAIVRYTTNPFEEVKEYLLRDILNRAMGNPDNHGRNTALQKKVDGTITLAPLYDFAPMKLSREMITRSTKWACLGINNADADWRIVCETVAEISGINITELKRTLIGKNNFLRALPEYARRVGTSEEVINRAINVDSIADSIEALKDE